MAVPQLFTALPVCYFEAVEVVPAFCCNTS